MRISVVLLTAPRVLVVGPGSSATYGTGSNAATADRSTTRTPADARVMARRDMVEVLGEWVTRRVAPARFEGGLEAPVLFDGVVGVGSRSLAARPHHPQHA